MSSYLTCLFTSINGNGGHFSLAQKNGYSRHIDELRYVAERWRMDYNHYRPHSSLGYMTPAEYAQLCEEVGCVKQRMRKIGQAELCETFSQELD